MLLREGSIAGGLVEPYSASVSTTNVLNRIINAAQSAFCQLGDGRGLAEGAGALGVGYAVFSGTHENGSPYVSEMVIGNNGGPASPHCDGWITYAMPDCSKTVYIDSVEMLERNVPASVPIAAPAARLGRSRAVARRASLGGGLRPVGDTDAGLLPGRLRAQPTPGSARRRSPEWRHRPVSSAPTAANGRPSRSVTRCSSRAQWIRGVEAGGGGYGDPLDRDPQAVLYDVLEGWVSAEAAEGVYGVVLRPDKGPVGLRVDEDATRLRREDLRATETKRGAAGS